MAGLSPPARPGFRLTIRMRIYGGFAAVLILMVATSLLSVFSLDRFSKDYGVAGAGARLMGTIREIDRNLLLMRQDVAEFYASGQPAFYADARSLRTAIDAAMTDATAQAASLDSHTADIERLKSSFEAYTNALAGMAALRAAQFTLVNVTLEQQGEDGQRRLEATASPAQVSNEAAIAITRRLLARFLEVRLDMGRVLARHDRALAAATAPNIKSLHSILNAFIERAADIVPQGQATAKAIGDFAASLEIADARDQALHDLLSQVLNPAADSLIAQITALVAEMTQAQAALDAITAHVLQTSRTFVTTAGTGGLVLGVLIAWLIGRSIASGVQAITVAMRRLAEGDQGAAIPRPDRRDELGEMSRALQVFKDNAAAALAMARDRVLAEERRASEDDRVRREAERSAMAEAAALVVESIGKGLERLAAGDLTFRVNQDLPAAYEKLRTDLNSAMAELQMLVTSIVANTAELQAGTGDITQAADDLSRRTEQQAASLQQTAAALDQITSTVQKTADGAKHASVVVSKTRADATLSGEVVRQAITAMSGIDQSSQQISQIIGVIDEIAFQTNLLALNAGVEAARAGEAGRGFAVVASEVRALAQRSAEAAKEIKALIFSSAQQVSTGVRLVGETGEALVRIVAQIGEVNGVVAAIAASAQEQAVGLGQVNTAINQMDQVTQQNAAMVEESTAASHTLAGDTAELARLTDRFQIGHVPAEGRARPKPKPVRAPAPQVQPSTKTPAKRVATRGTAAPKRWSNA